MQSERVKQGTIETRSGTWAWEVKTFRSWPKSNTTARRLRFEDPENAVNTMSLPLDAEEEEIPEESILDLSRMPERRRFEDGEGTLWIAHPVSLGHPRGVEPRRRITLNSLEHGSRVVDLPPGRTLGDMKNAELAELL